MKLYKVDIDLEKRSNKQIKISKGEDFILAVRAKRNGSTIQNLTVENDDNECLPDCDCEYEDYKCYALNLSADQKVHTHNGDDQICYISLNVEDYGIVDVDYTTKSPDVPTTSKPKVVFKDWNSAIPVYYDNTSEETYVIPGVQNECSSIAYTGFALTQPLSGNSQGTQLSDMTLAMAGFQVSSDTLIAEHHMGFSLWNECGSYVNVLKNRVSNVRISNGGYTSNVACFKSDEILPIAMGKLSVYVPANTEFWLSCNSTIYNPLG